METAIGTALVWNFKIGNKKIFFGYLTGVMDGGKMRSIVRDSSPSMQEVLDMMSFDMGVGHEWCDTSGTPEIKLRGGFLERFGFTVHCRRRSYGHCRAGTDYHHFDSRGWRGAGLACPVSI